MTNQPIEEKWKETFRKKFTETEPDNFYSTKTSWKIPEGVPYHVISFIENLLEQERKRMSDEVENRKMEGDCKDQNCSHDQCGTIRWYNKALNISLSIINK